MRYASSALKRCSDSLSSSAKTATVRLPSSLAARITRIAISPRLAIRIFSNSGTGASLPSRHCSDRAGPRQLLPQRSADVALLVGFVTGRRNPAAAPFTRPRLFPPGRSPGSAPQPVAHLGKPGNPELAHVGLEVGLEN